MTPADKTAFVRILVGLSSAKPGKDLTHEGIELYWASMQDWSIEEFTVAAQHLMRASEFMPNPYHFEQLRKASEPTAAEAWTLVRQQLPSMNWHERVSISPRIDRVVAALGGYHALGMTNSDQMHFREKRFAELWDELGTADEVRKAIPSLDPTNRLSGPQRGAVPQLTRQ